jgi:(2Fe-2S) ferredoxin
MTPVLRPWPPDFDGRVTLTVCVNVRPDNGISVSCGPRGGVAILDALAAEATRQGLAAEVTTIRCLGLCQRGPNVKLSPGNSWFHGVRPNDVPRLVELVVGHIAAR